jgi:hypothetical protein
MTSGADKIASSLTLLCLKEEEGRELVVEAMCSETRETRAVVPCGRRDGDERWATIRFCFCGVDGGVEGLAT